MQDDPFRYAQVILNLSGSKSYTLGQPWFYLQRNNKSTASILAIYVDNQRIHTPSKEYAYIADRPGKGILGSKMKIGKGEQPCSKLVLGQVL